MTIGFQSFITQKIHIGFKNATGILNSYSLMMKYGQTIFAQEPFKVWIVK
jgi:hypothetical protein